MKAYIRITICCKTCVIYILNSFIDMLHCIIFSDLSGSRPTVTVVNIIIGTNHFMHFVHLYAVFCQFLPKVLYP